MTQQYDLFPKKKEWWEKHEVVVPPAGDAPPRVATISLSPVEQERARVIGERRVREAEARGYLDKNCGMSYEETVAGHIVGAMGELACAKALGVEWEESVNTFKGIADVAGSVEVRTRTKERYELIVRPDDSDDRHYVHVFALPESTGGSREFVIRGFISGRDAKRVEWLRRHGGYREAYFVPNSALTPISVIKKILFT